MIQYMTDADGNRIAVVLDLDTYNQLIERLEDYEDMEWAREYEARRRASQLKSDELEMIPFEQAMAEIDAEETVTAPHTM